MTDINELIRNKIAQIKKIKSDIVSLEGEAKPIEPSFKEVAGDEMLSQQYRSAAQAMLRTNPEKAMELFAKAEQISASKSQKEASQKDKVTGLLNEVASDFANVDPNDQSSWTQAKDRWLQINQDLNAYIPSQASQDNWDRIQSQGGKGSNVAPKGDFAKQKKLENDITRLSILAGQAAAAGRSGEATELTDEALKLQRQLSGITKDTKTVSNVYTKYSSDIDKLEKLVTETNMPSIMVLQDKITKDIGEGKLLDDVMSAIKNRLLEVQGLRGVSGGLSRDMQKKITEVGSILSAMTDLENNKTSTPAKAGLLLSILRKESGAAIAGSEFADKMATWLGPTDYESMISELTGIGAIVSGRIGSDFNDIYAKKIFNKYLPKVDPNDIYRYAVDKAGADVVKAYKAQKNKPTLDGSGKGKKDKKDNDPLGIR